MTKLTRISVLTAMLAVLIGITGGLATAAGASSRASSGAWPAAYPLPVQRGTVIAQSSTAAVVRSTDPVAVVLGKLDVLYLTQKGCIRRLAVNKPRDYLCSNVAARKTDEVYFTFAALDPSAADPSRSQTNGFYVKG